MTLEEIQAFLKQAQEAGLLEDQTAIPEYSKFTNFYLSYRQPIPELVEFFEQIADEIAAHESLEARAIGKRANKRSAGSQVQFLACVKALALNAFQAQKKLIADYLHLAISLNANTYGTKKRYAAHSIAYRQLASAFYGMLRTGYLVIYRDGYQDPSGGGAMTRYDGTVKLFEAMTQAIGKEGISFYSDFAGREDEVIILRDKQKRYADYADTAETRLMRERLNQINAVLASHEIALNLSAEQMKAMNKHMDDKRHDEPEVMPYIDLTAVRLYRIFSEGSFERGGRFYRGWWQNVPEVYRRFITIDGQPTIEVDYTAFHPTILYAEQGLPLTQDPYKVHPNVHRDAGKVAFNALLNANTLPLGSAPSGYFHTDGITWPEYLEVMSIHHEPVAHLFTEGYGLTLQYRDSKLAESILLHFTGKGIPCLPIHDSFIVAEQHKTELESVMLNHFKRHFGTAINIK